MDMSFNQGLESARWRTEQLKKRLAILRAYRSYAATVGEVVASHGFVMEECLDSDPESDLDINELAKKHRLLVIAEREMLFRAAEDLQQELETILQEDIDHGNAGA